MVAENRATGYVWKTADGGATWKEILVAPDVSLFACSSLSDTEVRVGGGVLAQSGINGTVYSTVDGGNTWQLTSLPDCTTHDIG